MYHMDIPKTRQYDTGKVEVIARSSIGEALATTELSVIPRKDDYRGVLKNAPRREYYLGLLPNINKRTLDHTCNEIDAIHQTCTIYTLIAFLQNTTNVDLQRSTIYQWLAEGFLFFNYS